MAVVVQCFHCNTILELDEGFRGGVCRCSTCGSLLQVPKAANAGAPKVRPAAPGAAPTTTDRPATPTSGDSGLSRGQFAPPGGGGKRPVMPDFGGSSSGLRSGSGRPAVPTATRRIEKVEPLSGPTRPMANLKALKKNNALLIGSLVMLGLVVVVVVGWALWLVTRTQEEKHPEVSPSAQSTQTPSAPVRKDRQAPIPEPVAPAPPSPPAPTPRVVTGFLNVPLTGKKIVISIDGASTMSDDFDFVRSAVYDAVNRLKPDQQIRVGVWRNKSAMWAPKKGFVDKNGIEQLKEEFDAMTARGSSDPGPCMKSSIVPVADQVIFVTAKPLDESIVETVLAGKTLKARLDSVKLQTEDSPSPLEELAKKSGGVHRFLTNSQLQKMNQ